MSGERPRTPGVTYGVLALVMLLLLALVALTARQPPPPSIAEFAPQAIENITESPADQGRSGGRGVLPTPSPVPIDGFEEFPPIDVARVRRCVGDPPRQIEDPQSPPCVPYWEGDNGGATTRGVTRDTIRVGGYFQKETARVLAAFYNSRFEFYGRKLQLFTSGVPADCVGQNALAANYVEQVKVFAVLDSNSHSSLCLYQELARRKAIGINANNNASELEDMRPRAPYMWQYDIGTDGMLKGFGEMACKRLVGLNAIHAGDPVMKISKRKFGIFIQETQPNSNTYLPIHHLTRRLEECGVRDVLTFRYENTGEGSGSKYVADTQNGILQMQQARVTTVFCFCLIFNEAYIGPAATGQGYFPEWIVSSFGANDVNVLVKLFWTSEHRPQLFGLTTRNRQIPLHDEPNYQAAREIDQTVRYDDLAGFFTQYKAMLVLASGIQMAGPNLTPQTFEKALHRTVFPNPDHHTLPAKVGFLDADHGFANDQAEMWWSETAPGPDTVEGQADGQPGAYCYVDGGARRNLGAWPTDPDPFFAGECRSLR